MQIRKVLTTGLAIAALGSMASAADESTTVYEYDGSFDDASFAVRNAIIQDGLVIDFVSHVGDMLNRTREDVGGEKLLERADIFTFCSAVVTRQVVEADLMNIAQCPYGIFVAEHDETVTIGYRDYPDGSMEKVEQLLDKIVTDALER